MSDPQYSTDNPFYDTNLKFFKRSFVDNYERLVEAPVYENIKIVKGDTTNLFVGDVPYYTHSFEKNQAYQQDHFSRFHKHFSDYNLFSKYQDDFPGISQISARCYQQLYRLKNKYKPEPRSPYPHGGLLIVLGLGTGQHLEGLVKRFRPGRVIVVEESIHILRATLNFIDWPALTRRLKRLKCQVRVTCNNLSTSDYDVNGFLRDLGSFERLLAFSVDIVVHHSSSFYENFNKQILKHISSLKVVEGFIEDEVIMTRNIVTNIKQRDAKVITDIKRNKKKCPLLIVASGPSIDNHYKKIAELSKSMVLISCGTGIGGLLENGITPDFHCELENGPQITFHFNELRKKYSLDDIHLFASYSVDPGINKCFRNKTFFVRPGPRIGSFFSLDCDTFINCEPSVLNVATSFAINLGFVKAYVFGGDLGSRSPQQHHGQDIFFYNNKTIVDEFQVNNNLFDFPIETNANFGGLCYTNTILDLFYTFMAKSIQASNDIAFYNCSDGRLVEGMIPCLPESVPSFDTSASDKDDDIRSIISGTKDSSSLYPGVRIHIKRLLAANKRVEVKLLKDIKAHWPVTPDSFQIQNLTPICRRLLNDDASTKTNGTMSSSKKYENIIHDIINPSLRDILSSFLTFANYHDISSHSDMLIEARDLLSGLCSELTQSIESVRSLS